MKIADTPLTEFDLSVRAQGCVSRLGISTVQELARRDREAMQVGNVGTMTVLELAHVCQLGHCQPQFVGALRPSTLRAVFRFIESANGEWVPLTDAYGPNERSLLELALAQLGDREWRIAEQPEGFTILVRASQFRDSPEDVEDTK